VLQPTIPAPMMTVCAYVFIVVEYPKV